MSFVPRLSLPPVFDRLQHDKDVYGDLRSKDFSPMVDVLRVWYSSEVSITATRG